MLAGGELPQHQGSHQISHWHVLSLTVISPPILLGGSGGVNLNGEMYQYLVSTSLIASGCLSALQMARLRVYGTKYYIGTGLLSVVGTSIPCPTQSKSH